METTDRSWPLQFTLAFLTLGRQEVWGAYPDAAPKYFGGGAGEDFVRKPCFIAPPQPHEYSEFTEGLGVRPFRLGPHGPIFS
jgi:hypothetical protein